MWPKYNHGHKGVETGTHQATKASARCVHLGVGRLLGLEIPSPEAAPPDASTRLLPLPLPPPPLGPPPSADVAPFDLGNFEVAFILRTPFLKGSLALGPLVGLLSGWRRSSAFTTTPLDRRCCRCCSCDLDVVSIVVMAVVEPPVTTGFLEEERAGLRLLSCPYLRIVPVVPVELTRLATFNMPSGGVPGGKHLYAVTLFGVVVLSSGNMGTL